MGTWRRQRAGIALQVRGAAGIGVLRAEEDAGDVEQAATTDELTRPQRPRERRARRWERAEAAWLSNRT